MAEVVVVVVATILEDENVDSLEMGRESYGSKQNASEKGPGNVGIVDVGITFLKSAERNLDVLNRHIYLILVLLPRVVLLRVHLLFLALSRLYWRRRSMIDSDS